MSSFPAPGRLRDLIQDNTAGYCISKEDLGTAITFYRTTKDEYGSTYEDVLRRRVEAYEEQWEDEGYEPSWRDARFWIWNEVPWWEDVERAGNESVLTNPGMLTAFIDALRRSR